MQLSEANICLKLRPDSASGKADSSTSVRCRKLTGKRSVKQCKQKWGTNVMNCQVLMSVRKDEFSSVIQDASNYTTTFLTAITFQCIVFLETFYASGCSQWISCMFSGLLLGVNEIFAHMGCYTSWNGCDRRFGTSHRSNLQGFSSPKRMPGTLTSFPSPFRLLKLH